MTSRGGCAHSRESTEGQRWWSCSPYRVSRAFERRFPAALSRERWLARGRALCLARAPATGTGRPRAVCGACEQRDAAGAISGSSRRGQSRGPARVRGPLVTIVPFFAACRLRGRPSGAVRPPFDRSEGPAEPSCPSPTVNAASAGARSFRCRRRASDTRTRTAAARGAGNCRAGAGSRNG